MAFSEVKLREKKIFRDMVGRLNAFQWFLHTDQLSFAHYLAFYHYCHKIKAHWVSWQNKRALATLHFVRCYHPAQKVVNMHIATRCGRKLVMEGAF